MYSICEKEYNIFYFFLSFFGTGDAMFILLLSGEMNENMKSFGQVRYAKEIFVQYFLNDSIDIGM